MMFFCIPLLSALALFAKPFILLVFGEKWLPAAFFLQLHCLFRILSPLDNMNLQIAIAKKRSDINLKLEILKKLEFIIVILCLCWFSLKILMIGISLCGIIFFIENAWMSKKFINYSPWEQLYDILPIFIITGISAVCGGVFLFIVKTPLLCLLIGGSIYSILYLITSFYCRIFPVEILEHIPFLRFLSRFYKQS